uniref:Uncharacterized protein n=1 Tax=Oryza rufipogon TaxID=4529 RepID=A0A0E0RAU4_ORYRU
MTVLEYMEHQRRELEVQIGFGDIYCYCRQFFFFPFREWVCVAHHLVNIYASTTLALTSSFRLVHLRLNHPFNRPATTTSATNRHGAHGYAIKLRVATASSPWAAVPPSMVHLH